MISERERLQKTESIKAMAKDPEEIIVLSNGDIYRVAKFDSILYIVAQSILMNQINNGWSNQLLLKFMQLSNIQLCSAPEWSGYTLSAEAINHVLKDSDDFLLLFNHYIERYIAFQIEYEEKKRILNQS